jgi:hypothetical protein
MEWFMLKKIIFSIFLISSFSANAGLLLDPYVGMGNAKSTFDAASLDDTNDNATVLGARVGYSFLLFSLGADYQMATIDGANRTNLSAFAGFDLPILLRVWAEYTLNSSVDNDDLPSSVDVSFNDGYSVGIGFTGFPLVSVNLEIEQTNYTYENFPIVGDLDVSNAAYILSVSFPLNL